MAMANPSRFRLKPTAHPLRGLPVLLAVLVAALTAGQATAAARFPQSGAIGGFPGLKGGKSAASGAAGHAPAAAAGEEAGDGQTFGDSRDVVRIEVIPAQRRVMPGMQLPVAVVLDISSGWHIWTGASQAAALPAGVSRFDGAQYTAVKTDGPAGVLVGTGLVQWPAWKTVTADIGDGPSKYAVYEGRVVAFLPVEVRRDAATGALSIPLTLSFQACNENTCMQPADWSTTLSLTVEGQGGAAGAGSDAADPALFAAFQPAVFAELAKGDGSGGGPTAAGGAAAADPDGGLVPFDLFGWKASIDPRGAGVLVILLLAFVGGFALNLTPCVLPVIPLKIMGLSQSAGSRMRSFQLGLVLCAGVVAFWLGLALVMSAFTSIKATNELFQYPWFTLGLGLFIAMMAVGMAGFFSVRLPNFVYAFEPKHESAGGSFMVGVMTAVLSTPCTAPFMGSSIGWAVKIQSLWALLAIFGAVGMGMAVPYLVLSAFPQLVKRVPKSGPASELVKQVMGLLLLAAAAYFIGAGLTGILKLRTYDYWWAVAAVGTAAGVWLIWRTFGITRNAARRLVFGGIGAGIGAVSVMVGVVMAAQVDPVQWRPYTAAAEKEALAQGKVVVLDFTAHWCLTCKALEKAVLSSTDVAKRLNSPDVVPLKVDITDGDPEQKARLASAGRATIPLLVVLAPDGREVLKSDAYHGQQVLDAVNQAASSGSKTTARR